MRAIGLDVGGSAVKAGAVDGNGERRVETVRHLPPGVDFEQLIAFVGEIAEELGPADRVGVGAPGLLDREAGRILQSPNLPWLPAGLLRARVAAAVGLPESSAVLENDANAAALGEFWLGAGHDCDDLLFVTLGTGVGGGLILDGQLVIGAGGLAGEIGHVKVDPRGEPCGCGGRGCIETLASATAARRRALHAGLPQEAPGDLKRLNDRASSTPGPERDLLRAIGYDLGYGLSSALNLLDLRTYVIGGGFSAALPNLLPGIREGFRAGSYGQRTADVRVVAAGLGPSAGWIGAARAALLI
jgi:glucokinase